MEFACDLWRTISFILDNLNTPGPEQLSLLAEQLLHFSRAREQLLPIFRIELKAENVQCGRFLLAVFFVRALLWADFQHHADTGKASECLLRLLERAGNLPDRPIT